MAENNTGANIFAPKTVNELLAVKQQYPDALLWAGGTALMRQQRSASVFSRNIIQLSGIDELKKIRRTERYLEIGSCVPIKRILNVGQHILPFALSEALKSIAPPHIRNRATLGGNLCCRQRRLNTFSVLLLMDTVLEIRKSGKTRWIGLNRLFTKKDKDSIQNNEVVTRIRIPLNIWNIQYFTAAGDPFLDPLNAISFSLLIETHKGLISQIRFAVGNIGKQILRSIDFESYLSERKVRLRLKEIDTAVEYFHTTIKDAEGLTPFQKERTTRFILWFLHELRDYNLFTE